MAFLLRGSGGGFRPRPTQFSSGQSITLPAPYGGLNLRDDITTLPPNQARTLINWTPDTGRLSLRPGFAGHATSVGSGEVKTLAVHHGISSQSLLAGGGTGLEDASSTGAATSKGTSFSEDRWQHDNFVKKLFLVNGTDAPQDYDGSTLSATSWTGSGLTITNLINVANVRNRLWFCEVNQGHVWYGGLSSVTGALTKFDLAQIAAGGYCMAITSWSRDAGDGQDDFTVFIMSTGELIIYSGDPAGATLGNTLTLIGKYQTGAAPIGRQCFFKVGGEPIIITRLGLLPVTAAIAGGSSLDFSLIEPWGKIASMIEADAISHGGNPGWSGVAHQGIIYITVPQVAGLKSKTIVLVQRTSAWTTYEGWNQSALASFNDKLYLASQTGGLVNLAEGDNDNGTNITATARGAFAVPGKGTNLFTAARPKLQAQGEASGFIGVDTDYFESSIAGDIVGLLPNVTTTAWGDGTKGNSVGGDWGDPWGSKPQPFGEWFGIQGDGRSVAVKMQAFASSANLKWLATDLLFKPGSIK